MTKNLVKALGGILRGLARCRRGVSTIEFAFAAPILVITMMGVIELGMIMFMSALLEGAVRDASRFGLTGYAPAGMSREQIIAQTISDDTLGLVDPADLTISTQVYGDFSQIGQPEPYVDANPANGVYDLGEEFVDVNGNGQWDADMGVAGVGGPGDVVVYTVSINWPLLTPLLDGLLGDQGRMALSASITVRNEPYNTSQGG